MFTIDNKNQMTVTQGDTALFDITITNYSPIEGDILYYTVKTDVSDVENTVQKVITEFEGNVAKIVLSTEDTNIPVGSYVYDIQISFNDGRVETVVGPTKFKIVAGVTHD